jgi:hypothetical protein
MKLINNKIKIVTMADQLRAMHPTSNVLSNLKLLKKINSNEAEHQLRYASDQQRSNKVTMKLTNNN